MRYCENCGSQLPEGIRFCEECGAQIENTVDKTVQEPSEVIIPEEPGETQCTDEELEQENRLIPSVPDTVSNSKQELQKEEKRDRKSGKKKAGIIIGLIAILLIIGGIVALWKLELWQGEEQTSAVIEPVRTVDPDNLYGTLTWKSDQDQEYALKNSLIEGNADANIKEIFEESAYFTPKEHKYASNKGQMYYQIVCQYEKGDKSIPYVLVFKINQQEHLELSELYKKEKRIDNSKFDSFYKKLYTTRGDVEAAKVEAKKKENKRAKLPADIYANVQGEYFYDIEVINSEYFEEESEYGYIYVKSIDDDKIITEHGSLEGPYDLTFHRTDDKSSESYSYSITSDESDWSDEITLTKDDLANETGHYKITYTTYENGVPYRIAEYHVMWW